MCSGSRGPTVARKPPTGTSVFTNDFRHEYEAERERWLRKRFLWYTGVVAILSLLATVATLVALVFAGSSIRKYQIDVAWIGIVTGLIGTIPYVGSFFYAREHTMQRDQLVKFAYALIIFNGVLQLITPLVTHSLVKEAPRLYPVGGEWILNIVFTHVFACLFLPLTPRESFRPLIPLLALNAGFSLFSGDDWLAKILVIVFSPLIGAPGALICWWRYSRFRDRFALNQLRGRYAELRHELHSARQIHESLFPQPITEGPVTFRYIYEPMRQIGGDYLYAAERVDEEGRKCLNVALLDVTGHGIPAALTVNRLHGELDRIFAENPGIGPGEVLTLLNRYVHLTLANHSVYVTALCFKIDPSSDTLHYASGGHPPAFLRAVDGSIEQLDSTSFVLGAAAGNDFQASPRSLRFGPGDALIAYTDGATEARDVQGRYLGVAGILGVIAAGAGSGGWPAVIAQAVDRHRHGPIADDTLVIEITRPIESHTRTVSIGGRASAGVVGAGA
jgi:hypothetical protein